MWCIWQCKKHSEKLRCPTWKNSDIQKQLLWANSLVLQELSTKLYVVHTFRYECRRVLSNFLSSFLKINPLQNKRLKISPILMINTRKSLPGMNLYHLSSTRSLAALRNKSTRCHYKIIIMQVCQVLISVIVDQMCNKDAKGQHQPSLPRFQ